MVPDRVSLVRRVLLPAAEVRTLLPGWRLVVHDVQGSVDLAVEAARDGRTVRLTLSPDAARPAFRRTRHFGLSYAGDLDADVRRVLEAVTWLVAKREGALSEARRMLLARGYAIVDGVLSARLTLACNERCVFCFASEEAPENVPDLVADPATLVADLPLLASLGLRSLLITGGEPTLVPLLPDLLGAARAAGFTDLELQTNARRFADPRFVERVRGALPDRAFVSLYAVDQAAYQALGRTRADVAERLQGLGVLLDLGVRTSVNVVLVRETLPALGDLVAALHARFGARLEMVTFSMVAPFGLAWKEPAQIPRLSEVAPVLGPALLRAEELGLTPRIPAGCSLPACVLPGLVRFFQDAAASPQAAREGKGKPASCRRCARTRSCPGVWSRYRELYGDAELVPLPR